MSTIQCGCFMVLVSLRKCCWFSSIEVLFRSKCARGGVHICDVVFADHLNMTEVESWSWLLVSVSKGTTLVSVTVPDNGPCGHPMKYMRSGRARVLGGCHVSCGPMWCSLYVTGKVCWSSRM